MINEQDRLARDERIIAELRTGKLEKDIAAAVGTSTSYVSVVATKNGLGRPRGVKKNEQRYQEVSALLKEEETYQKIGDALGLSKQRIGQIAMAMGMGRGRAQKNEKRYKAVAKAIKRKETYQKMADDLGISRQRIGQIAKKLRKCQLPSAKAGGL